MSDEDRSGLPTDEQLRRIRIGVQRRIDRRRQVGRRVAGGVVALALVAGGVALVRPVLGTSSASSGSAAGGGTAGDTSSSATAVVVCHDGSETTKVAAERSALPASALRACMRLASGAAASARPNDLDGGASPAAPPAPVLCVAPSGTLHVYLGDAAVCADNGMRLGD